MSLLVKKINYDNQVKRLRSFSFSNNSLFHMETNSMSPVIKNYLYKNPGFNPMSNNIYNKIDNIMRKKHRDNRKNNTNTADLCIINVYNKANIKSFTTHINNNYNQISKNNYVSDKKYNSRNKANIKTYFYNKQQASFFSIIKNYIPSISKNYNTIIPNFNCLFDSHIKENTLVNPDHTYNNKVYWAPKFYLQKDLSLEFLTQLKKFKRKDSINEIDQFALAQIIITEAIRDTTFKIAYDYECVANKRNYFHGNIPMLIYNTDPEY